MKPLERLFEREGLPTFGLPAALTAIYGGDFGLTRPELYANFVSSVDGVVALAGAGESGRVVRGDNAKAIASAAPPVRPTLILSAYANL